MIETIENSRVEFKVKLVDEVDVTVEKKVKKANIFDYMLRNLKILGKGKSLLKQ